MTSWLLDTNVISETRRQRPSSAVLDWLATLDNSRIWTSTMNIAELRHGALVADGELLQMEISNWIERVVKPWLGPRLVEANENALLRWRIMARQREINREPSPAVDMLIAAIAQENGLGVATGDVAPFVACGVPVLNPWTGERFNGA